MLCSRSRDQKMMNDIHIGYETNIWKYFDQMVLILLKKTIVAEKTSDVYNYRCCNCKYSSIFMILILFMILCDIHNIRDATVRKKRYPWYYYHDYQKKVSMILLSWLSKKKVFSQHIRASTIISCLRSKIFLRIADT